ncbi:hypothetical protein BLNAU_17181 [Blattamonas nauphoetae]|uniref:Uncharacterized protein n=1 Tax=Blattamonas nauphoetae TaxID=2049346 RepID=A0ABQ9X7K2_9EUKA|nr:hypothetical protein BLNAU_17181 [Blattamonas nauphoetae]
MHTRCLEARIQSILKHKQQPSSNSLAEYTLVACRFNTSLCVEKCVFHVIGRTHGMIEVHSSSLWVSEWTVLSEGSLSPFGISGGGCSGSSISILSSKYSGTNERVMSLPPLTSLTLPSKHDPTHQDISTDTFDTSMNAVVGSGVCLSSIDLGFGTGPLVAPETTRHLFAQTRQTLVSYVVEVSINHFSGTATADLNMCRSFLASNLSFSKCSSNLAPSDQHPTSTLNHRTGTDLIDIANGMDGQDVDITRCPFTHTTSSTNPSAVHFAAQPRTPKSTRWAGAVSSSTDHRQLSISFSSCLVAWFCDTPNSGGFGTVVVFSQTDSAECGSPLTVVDVQSPTQNGLSNSIFKSAYSDSSENGSALFVGARTDVLLSSLRFVDTDNNDADDV